VHHFVTTEKKTMATLTSVFAKNITSSAQPAIIIPEGPALDYYQLGNQVSEFKNILVGASITPGSTVSIILGNTLEFVIAFLGVTNSRGLAAPLNPGLSQQEFKFYFSDSKSKLILVPKGQIKSNSAAIKSAQELNIPIAEVYFAGGKIEVEFQNRELKKSAQYQDTVLPDDIALLLHTSGTTGLPKAVPLTHGNIHKTMGNVINTYNLNHNDRTFLVMPLFHVHGLVAGLLSSLLSGGTVVIPPRFTPTNFWKHFINYGCTWYTAVPTIHQILLSSPDSRSPTSTGKLRFIRSCSSSLAPATFHTLEKTFKVPVLEAYAMTEAAHQVCSNPLPPQSRKPGTVGLPQGVELSIRDNNGNVVHKGEVCIRGSNVTKGYLNNKKANDSSYHADNWFRTGDEGILDEEGYLTLTGRIKELVNRGGEKIAPGEVDHVLLEHPDVEEAVAFAVPDDKYGQDIQAAVVLKKGKNTQEEELRSWVGKHLISFKVPKRVYITDKMPKTATGKIQRAKVSEAFFKPQSKL